MEKTYILPDKAAIPLKLWPAVITLCGIFLIWSFEATTFRVFFAAIASGLAWWRSGYVAHSITIGKNGPIQFTSILKEIEIRPEDIHTVVENTYYKEIAILSGKGRIAVPSNMPNIVDFINTLKQLNPDITVKSGKRIRPSD